MSRIVNRAEAWEVAYTSFQNINFSAFDFNTIKESMLDYIKLYFPENFNDYIESSEFIAILELFSYVGEILAYRLDLNAHENFLTTAQRKESILRLAKLISYSASRNLPARGLVKVTSIATTETIFDSSGRNLANRVIRWNDQNNIDWKEQFLVIINRILEQPFGTVTPSERVQLDDVLFELYSLNNAPISDGVLRFSATVSGQTLPMELTPVTLTAADGITEKRPAFNSSFSILYGSDGLGDTSDTTGFFGLLKQGTLQRLTTTFDGVTPNQTYEILINNINDTDMWVNNVDPDTGETLDDGLTPEHKSGEWVEVDLAHAQNIIFNTNKVRQKYETETLNNDNVRLIFGDGEFADIPSGQFDIWFRSSVNTEVVIPQNVITNQILAFSYVDGASLTQTLTVTVSLINSLQNASPSEDIEHIRRVAPSVYYTQDRMVNGRDYNTFMLQDSSILKLRSINRTFAGDSKYIVWHDPRESYENVKIFGDDLLLYLKEAETAVTVTNTADVNILISGYIQPLLASSDIFVKLVSEGVNQLDATRRTFTATEITNLGVALNLLGIGGVVELFYDTALVVDQWITFVDPSVPPLTAIKGTNNPYSTDTTYGLITVKKIDSNTWIVGHTTSRLIAESQTTRFWNTNAANSVVDYDSLVPGRDTVVIFKANDRHDRVRNLSQNYNFNVVSQELDENSLPDIHRLNILPVDTNKDTIPDGLDLVEILNPKITITATGVVVSPIYYIVGEGDVSVTGTIPVTQGTHWFETSSIATFGAITGGSLYTNGSYINVPLTGGTGTGATANITVAGAVVTVVTLVNGGSGYAAGNVLSALSANIGGTGSGFSIPVNTIVTNVPSNTVSITSLNGNAQVTVTVKDYVYFNRLSTIDPWVPQLASSENIALFIADDIVFPHPDPNQLWKRYNGRDVLNFAWLHTATNFRLIDPAASNIVDTYIISRGYYTQLRQWLNGIVTTEPDLPTPLTLRTDYGYLLDNKMISDTVILHPGKIKLVFGSKAAPELRAKFKIIRPVTKTLTDNQVKSTVVDTIKVFFDINKWEFGETFYASELFSFIHNALSSEIDSVVLVPENSTNQFGDLFQVLVREDEIIQPDITVDNIEIVSSYNSQILRQ